MEGFAVHQERYAVESCSRLRDLCGQPDAGPPSEHGASIMEVLHVSLSTRLVSGLARPGVLPAASDQLARTAGLKPTCARDTPGKCKPDAAPAPITDLVVGHAGIQVLSAAETLEAAAALDGGLYDDEGSQCPVCSVAGLANKTCRGLLALHAGLIGRVGG